MRVFLTVFACAAALTSPASAQQEPEIRQGWRKVDGVYVNAATLMRCPETLSDGYKLTNASVFSQSNDVSCRYTRSGTESILSFYFYPAVGSVDDEFTSTSRPILSRAAPGVSPSEGTRSWALPGAQLTVKSIEVTDTNGIGQSFAIADIAGRRMKARESWEGTSEVSHRVADGFFALQTNALANARTCAALPAWGATRRARLSSDAMQALMPMVLLSSVPADAEAAPKPDQPTSVTPPAAASCVLATVGELPNGSAAILQRDTVDTFVIRVENQPRTEVFAGLMPMTSLQSLGLNSDSTYVLYSYKDNVTSFYRAYKTLPSLDQISADLTSVATGALSPLMSVTPKAGEEGPTISVNADGLEAERRKQRPGAR